ncbi:sensor histidine kinase [Silvibacterium acidisoli]|uniref:sensor histidine kinase n=1 Tax=Acidobacteriaceae bacterium ZG23-2 TaxID=2883246 RepID=UPI00406C966D
MNAQKDIRVANISDLPSVVRRGSENKEERGGEREPDNVEVAEFLRANQKLISLGQLAATIAHEINNPLESLTNLLYLLEQDQGLSERSKGYLGIAQRELDRTAQICRQTLRFSRDTGTPVPVHMGELVEEVLVLFGRKLAARKIEVVREFGRMDTVVAFPGEMRQIITNLISNAIEACTGRGRIIVRIRSIASRHGRGPAGLRLSVADNGPGIPPEVIPRLGKPFFTTKGQSGTGLGLCVTKTILNSHGGRLSIRSSTAKETHGSVFSIFLPVQSQERAQREPGRGNLQLVRTKGN